MLARVLSLGFRQAAPQKDKRDSEAWSADAMHSGAPGMNKAYPKIVQHGDCQIDPGDNATMTSPSRRSTLVHCPAFRRALPTWGTLALAALGPSETWRAWHGRKDNAAARSLASIRRLPKIHDLPARICGPGCTWVLLRPENLCVPCVRYQPLGEPRQALLQPDMVQQHGGTPPPMGHDPIDVWPCGQP